MGEKEKPILIVEDDRHIVDILDYNLLREGYRTLRAYDGEEGLRLALEASPALVLLDVMLPRRNGFDVCRLLREKDKVTPVLLLTALEAEDDKVRGLEAGADDYITKPFAMKELLARVRANIRRAVESAAPPPPLPPAEFVYRDLRIHRNRLNVTRGGEPCDLSQKEYDLLLYLADARERVVTREELLEKVWGYTYLSDDMRVVDVAVRRLREKLEKNPAEPEYIVTKRGAGYMFGLD
ncbi:MAG: response regulator transcription factor [Oscillospiraceae bacterium]|jgi:two-component system response regulator VicR|nr:response regulator transcription factor [Oscillospiraceae bacterium]